MEREEMMEQVIITERTSNFGILSVKEFLSRHLDSKPALRAPSTDLADLVDSFWWTNRIEYIEYVDMKFQMSTAKLTPFAHTFADLHARTQFASDLKAIEAFDTDPQWIQKCEEIELFFF